MNQHFFQEIKIHKKVGKSHMIVIGNEKIEYLSSGMFKSDLPWIHNERTIDSYEIIAVLKNQVHLEENGHSFHLKEGDILLLEPLKKHRGIKTSPNGCAFYWLHFKTDRKNPFPFKQFNINHTTQKDHILFFLSQIIHVSELSQYSAETSDALCYTLLEYLAVANQTNFDKQDKTVNEVVEYIRLNNTVALTVQQIAEHFSYHPDYLSMIFKQKTNIGLKQYLDHIRIHTAKTLLLTSNFSIKQIAAILHFSTPQNFISFFKYHEKTSPQKYRAANVGVHYNQI